MSHNALRPSDFTGYFNLVAGYFAAPLDTPHLRIRRLRGADDAQALFTMMQEDDGDYVRFATDSPEMSLDFDVDFVRDQVIPLWEKIGQSRGSVDLYAQVGINGPLIAHMTMWIDDERRTRLSPYILPSYRRSTLAREMYEAVAEHAVAKGLFPAGHIRAEVSIGNERSRAFYEKMGFILTGTSNTPARGLAPEKQHRYVLRRDFI